MNVRQIAIILVALILAGGSFMLMKKQGANAPVVANNVAAPAAPAIKTTKVLVTNRDYAVGDRILPSTLIFQDWPANGNLQSFVTQETNPKAAEAFVDAVVTVPMVAGEPIILNKIVLATAKDGVMAALLTPGMRATSVSITPDSSVAGFILPNNRVDVLLTRQVPFQINNQTVNRTVSSTILENVRVLAIDQQTATTKEQKAFAGSTATLELNPADAEKLKAADNLGDISLVLRSYADVNGPTVSKPNALALAQPKPTNVRADGQNSTQQPPSAPGAPVNTAANVKIYRGGQ